MDCSMPGFPVLHHLACWNSCLSSQWCHPTISSSVIPFSSCLQFSSIRVFSNESALCISWPKYWSFSFSISPSKDIQDWFPLVLTGLISFQSKGLSRIFSNTAIQKHQCFATQPSLWSNSYSHPYMTTGKAIALTSWTFVSKVMPLLFNALSRFVIAFLLRSKHLLILWLQSPSAVILEHTNTFSLWGDEMHTISHPFIEMSGDYMFRFIMDKTTP